MKLIDKILDIIEDEGYLQNEAKQKRVKKYREQIDRLVYKLYDFTSKEIKIIKKNK